jgi:hypothetical protein
VLEFNPVNPADGNKSNWLLNNRDHRRQLIVDGRIAFTGGVNISDTYGSVHCVKLHTGTTRKTQTGKAVQTLTKRQAPAENQWRCRLPEESI